MYGKVGHEEREKKGNQGICIERTALIMNRARNKEPRVGEVVVPVQNIEEGDKISKKTR